MGVGAAVFVEGGGCWVSAGMRHQPAPVCPLPQKLKGRWVAVIQTPAPLGRKSGIGQSKVIGLIKFANSKQYLSGEEWHHDYPHHLVQPNDRDFVFKLNQLKFGWIVQDIARPSPHPAPPRKGIIYARPFEVVVPLDVMANGRVE